VGPTCSRPCESETPPMQSADFDAPQDHAHDESANRGGGVPNTSAQRAPSVSDGVLNEPEASSPGLPNQPRGGAEGSGSTTANDPATSNTTHNTTTPPAPLTAPSRPVFTHPAHLQPAAPESSAPSDDPRLPTEGPLNHASIPAEHGACSERPA
jgi:hypothetical protein